jgi:hypothetical protein
MRRVVRTFALLAGGLIGTAPLAAQSVAPAPPAEYDVQLRYRLALSRTQRVEQFPRLEARLTQLGLVLNEYDESDLEDLTADRFSGVVPSAKARALLQEPYVATLLLTPKGYKLPAAGRVKAQFDLVGGLPVLQQRLLSEQSLERLRKLGFDEQVGYDHQGFTRLRGTIGAEVLPTLLHDLRTLPTGWLVSETSLRDTPQPLAGIVPVRLIEVLPEPEGVPAAVNIGAPPTPGLGQAYLGKLTPDVLSLISNDMTKTQKNTRLELFLDPPPTPQSVAWRKGLTASVEGLVIEGRMGGLVTVVVPRAEQAADLAALNWIATIRLPRSAQPHVIASPLPPAAKSELLAASKLDQLHTRGRQGDGIRVVLIGHDFTGAAELIGRELPKDTRLIDATIARSPEVRPDPSTTPATELGHGTLAAKAVILAAPAASLTLVRVAPDSPYMVHEVARFVLGEAVETENFLNRFADFAFDNETLQRQRNELNTRRTQLLNQFDDEVGPVQALNELTLKLNELKKKEVELAGRVTRMQELQAAFLNLRDAHIVANTLAWDVGQALDGLSPLSAYLDDKLGIDRPAVGLKRQFLAPKPLWFQSAGDTRGQTWSGGFRDGDGNGVLEFAPATMAIRDQRWTRELNFIGLARVDDYVPDLPANAKLRVSVQWREPNDADTARLPDDVYRAPLADLKLLVVRQRDPNGEKVASDDLDVIARSGGLPQRLERQTTHSSYEQSVEFVAPVAGRYALRIEGRVPPTLLPRSVPNLPGQQQTQWQLRPRVVLTLLDDASRQQGRPIFVDYSPEPGGVGTPGDARSVITVGAALRGPRAETFSAIGAGPGLGGLTKPNVWAFDELPIGSNGTQIRGTSVATGFSAGLAATLLSAGAPQGYFLDNLRLAPGHLFMVPPEWLPKK